VGYNLFQRPSAGPAGNGDDEFASTVAAMPTGAGELRALGPAAQAEAPGRHPQPADSVPADSQPADSGLLDSQPASSELEPETPPEQRPTIAHIGRYALKGPLGSGGLGQVHEAWDPLLSRVVAVKTLQFETDPRERVALDGLFLNEARAVAGLNHPHIVTIYDAGLSAHGVYIAMERLHGRDLRHALAGGWLPSPAQAALLVRRVADALAYAHARGVVHCDVKPANIFLDRRHKPKVLDFGIARVAHGRPSTHLDGYVLGSPHYLAPEQLEGREVDARTDIHALGVVFYELLAGRRAFGGDSVEQITTAILTHHPAPAHELRPEVPKALSQIAAKAMARSPEQRFQSALAMAMELRRWLAAHEAAQAAAAPARPRRRDTTAPPRRRALLWAGGALAGVALLAVAAGTARRQAAGPAQAEAPSLPAAGTSGAVAPAATVAPAAPAAPAAEAPGPAGTAAAEPSPAPALAGDAAPLPPSPPQPGTPPTAAAKPPAAATARPATRPAAASRPRNGPAPAPAPSAAPTTTAPGGTAAVASGTLQLAISPWGEVEVDGRAVGIAPPLNRLSLPAGTHQVVVRNTDFPPLVTTVQVEADGVTLLRHRFAP